MACSLSNKTVVVDKAAKSLALLRLLLLAALLPPTVCSSDEMPPSRHSRSSHVDASDFVSENLSNLMDSKPNESYPRKLQKQRPAQHPLQRHEVNDSGEPGSKLDETIRSIFRVGPEVSLTLFNNTLITHIPPSEQVQAEDSFVASPPHHQQPPKVQRSLMEKLKQIFNKFLFLQRPTEAQSSTKPTNKDFVFPDQLYVGSKPQCEESFFEGKPFCTKVSNYPSLNHLESILKSEFSKFELFFSEDLAEPQNITQRMNNEPEEEYLCNSIEKIIYPEAALTRDSNWLLIVNDQENFRQGVRIEECLNEGDICNAVQFPNHYSATCKQHYIYRSMVAITPNGSITKDYFKMPSCCKCVLRQLR